MHGKSTTLHNSMSPVHQTWHTQIADCILMNCQIWYLSISSMWKYNCPVHNLKTYKVWYYIKITFLSFLSLFVFSFKLRLLYFRPPLIISSLLESPGPPVRLSLPWKNWTQTGRILIKFYISRHRKSVFKFKYEWIRRKRIICMKICLFSW